MLENFFGIIFQATFSGRIGFSGVGRVFFSVNSKIQILSYENDSKMSDDHRLYFFFRVSYLSSELLRSK